MGWSRVTEACLAAGGVLDVASAARASGLSERAIREGADRDGWWRPYPQVIAPPGHPRDGLAWARASVLHARGRARATEAAFAAVTRDTALAVLGFRRGFPTRVQVAIPAIRRVGSGPRLQVVRPRLLQTSDVRERDGVPVVVGCPLLRDLAAVRQHAALRDVTIDLAKAGVVDLEDLPEFLASQPPFPGKPRLRQVASDLLGAGRTDSPFELQVRERLADDGVLLDRGQVPIPSPMGIHVDLGIRAIRFGIECVSFGFHAIRADLERDAERANEIASLPEDWRVLHATWSVLGQGWSRFVDQVREVIAAQSRRHRGTPWPGPEHLV